MVCLLHQRPEYLFGPAATVFLVKSLPEITSFDDVGVSGFFSRFVRIFLVRLSFRTIRKTSPDPRGSGGLRCLSSSLALEKHQPYKACDDELGVVAPVEPPKFHLKSIISN